MLTYVRRRIAMAASALLILVMAVVMSGGPAVAQGNPNPKVIPNNGPRYGELGAEWWKWAFSFPLEEVPFFNTGGPVDLSAGQSGNVWFLAGANNGLTEPRTGEIPAGTSLFFPLANVIADYPCPPEYEFEPEPGETLEAFLQRAANEWLPSFTNLFAEIDGVPLSDLARYRATSSLFMFEADPALVAFDPCITGELQPGVAAGYWLLLPPLPPGEHTLHFGAPDWNQDIEYVITVVPGR